MHASAVTGPVAPPIRQIIFVAGTFRNGRAAKMHDLRIQFGNSDLIALPLANVSPEKFVSRR
ncbi:hypothetical protein FLX27_20560 [Agrobacterium tumefaciens]|nr:hypothetical protein FLX27_20560 [Agrobacterium tumefaciens]